MECEACGVIFARYKQVLDRRKELEEQKAATAKKSGVGLKLLQVLLLVIVVASTTYYFTGGRAVSPPVPPQGETAPAAPIPPPAQPARVEKASGQQGVTPSPSAIEGNSITRATNATVSIETPWGTGSGFFINSNYIVTNRHVVQIDEKKIGEFRHKVETSRRLIELEQQKIKDMKRELQRLPKGPSRSQLALIITANEENLQKILPHHEEGESRLAKLEKKVQPSDIKIVLVDGSVHVANYLLVSDTYDLALMSLFSGGRTFIGKSPDNARLQTGEKVFVIGSPVGLRHTVTSGIFSGLRSQGADGQVYLQTDAPINPGNSGGPLIDEKGNVHGVTTMILRETEGIGFAIPIATVYEEFRSTLF